MRQLKLIILGLVFTAKAFAFHDPKIFSTVSDVLKKLPLQTTIQERANTLDQLKESLFQKLSSIQLPNIDQMSESDPRLEEYRSLTEFDTYVEMIKSEDLTVKNCEALVAHLNSAAQSHLTASKATPPELDLAQKIALAACAR